MEILIKRFALTFTIFTLFLALVSLLLYEEAFPQYYLKVYPFVLLYFYLLGFLGMFLYGWSMKHTPKKTSFHYLALRILKMIVSVLLAFVYCMIDRENVVVFVLTFAIAYLLYMVFETWFYYTLGTKLETKNN